MDRPALCIIPRSWQGHHVPHGLLTRPICQRFTWKVGMPYKWICGYCKCSVLFLIRTAFLYIWNITRHIFGKFVFDPHTSCVRLPQYSKSDPPPQPPNSEHFTNSYHFVVVVVNRYSQRKLTPPPTKKKKKAPLLWKQYAVIHPCTASM